MGFLHILINSRERVFWKKKRGGRNVAFEKWEMNF